MIIRKAVTDDIEALLQNRLQFLSIFNKEITEDLINNTKEYMNTHMADNTMISYIAVEDEVT